MDAFKQPLQFNKRAGIPITWVANHKHVMIIRHAKGDVLPAMDYLRGLVGKDRQWVYVVGRDDTVSAMLRLSGIYSYMNDNITRDGIHMAYTSLFTDNPHGWQFVFETRPDFSTSRKLKQRQNILGTSVASVIHDITNIRFTKYQHVQLPGMDVPVLWLANVTYRMEHDPAIVEGESPIETRRKAQRAKAAGFIP